MGNIGDINKNICIKNDNKYLMMIGRIFQHVKPEVIIRQRKIVTKCLKCQGIPQRKYGSENKKGNYWNLHV